MRTSIDKIPTSPSFPSGHSFSAAAIYPAIAFIIALPLKNLPLKILITALGIVLASLVGFSRIYLGFHFLSDVLVGLTGGFIFATVIAFLVKMPFILGQTSTPEHRNKI